MPGKHLFDTLIFIFWERWRVGRQGGQAGRERGWVGRQGEREGRQGERVGRQAGREGGAKLPKMKTNIMSAPPYDFIYSR